MNGKTLIIAGLIFAAIFGAALWYFQTRGFYRELAKEPLVVGGTTYAVSEWKGIDASSSPIKRRLCLRLTAETATKIAAAQKPVKDAEPLTAPDWFDCFDARQIHKDLEAGLAKAFVAGPSTFKGVDDYIAVYPDGRAYVWRQLQPEFRGR